MSQQDGFGSGFIIGSIVGGVIGGVLGTLLTTRQENKSQPEKEQPFIEAGTQTKFTTEESIELARRGLEDKIAQLNLAIDDVRQQLGSVNGSNEVEE